jgi:catechol 2,3-dioxygenase-like lactoylglutathione lyase family enzyme
MSRIQLALNVSDINAAVDHYSKVFDTAPAKRQPGYANFAIADPPLKLVLFENTTEPGTLNHLGTEMDSSAEVDAAARRLRSSGIEAEVADSQTCCYATQDKAWTSDPDGLAWEIYTVLDDSEEFGHSSDGHGDGDAPCCAPQRGSTDPVEACC